MQGHERGLLDLPPAVPTGAVGDEADDLDPGKWVFQDGQAIREADLFKEGMIDRIKPQLSATASSATTQELERLRPAIVAALASEDETVVQKSQADQAEVGKASAEEGAVEEETTFPELEEWKTSFSVLTDDHQDTAGSHHLRLMDRPPTPHPVRKTTEEPTLQQAIDLAQNQRSDDSDPGSSRKSKRTRSQLTSKHAGGSSNSQTVSPGGSSNGSSDPRVIAQTAEKEGLSLSYVPPELLRTPSVMDRKGKGRATDESLAESSSSSPNGYATAEESPEKHVELAEKEVSRSKRETTGHVGREGRDEKEEKEDEWEPDDDGDGDGDAVIEIDIQDDDGRFGRHDVEIMFDDEEDGWQGDELDAMMEGKSSTPSAN